MLLLVSTAFAGVLLEESEVQSMCESDSSCFVVHAEVIDASCRGVAEGSLGEVISNYSATLSVLDEESGLGLDELELYTTGYDYSNAEEMPSCYDTDPGHPIGEQAVYYVYESEMEGIFNLYMSGTYFLTAESDGDLEPICDALPEQEAGDDTGIDQAEHDHGEEPEGKSGCQMVSPVGFLPLIFSTFMLWGRRQDRE